MTRHAQIVQSNKFAIFLQYCKKQINEEVDFLLADKHESILQINILVLVGIVKDSQVSQESKFVMSLQYLKNEVREEVDFLHRDKHQSFLQADLNILSIKVS